MFLVSGEENVITGWSVEVERWRVILDFKKSLKSIACKEREDKVPGLYHFKLSRSSVAAVDNSKAQKQQCSQTFDLHDTPPLHFHSNYTTARYSTQSL